MGITRIFPVFTRKLSTNITTTVKMKFLNVAEKNDAAKNIAGYLSRGTSRRREGLSKFNKIYEFEAQVMNQNVTMIMTSVSGHLLNYEFIGQYRNWTSCNPLVLFDAPVIKACPNNDYAKIKETLEREIRGCQGLIIWTDCDREGENIGFEIINVCQAVKANLQVYRAKFSEITAASVQRALRNLERPNKLVSDAVDVRQELDLRIGAAFTRLQTLRFRQVFPEKLADNLISYGSCQFPTLGFVVDRYKAIEDFVPQPFWKIKMSHTIDELTVHFLWKRDRLFDRDLVEAVLDLCLENPIATVTGVISKPKNKWRPLPLDTIEMEKSASRKLKLNAKTTMQIAEKLYSKGFISYPRTETNIFPKELNLTNLIQNQTSDSNWGAFASRILQSGPNPRQGKKSDQAHPPIHPIKYADNLDGNEKRVYEFIVRHFLACCSEDAKGMETVVDVVIAGEAFQATGLMIHERNYLEVYPYEKWNAKEIHIYQLNQQFEPTELEMAEGSTTAPALLTEADLISLMEKHGIGTDATHAEHISTIQQREYVALPDGVHFVPGLLGMGLVEGYDQVGLSVSLAKPNLRAELENDLKLICDGIKHPKPVLEEQISKYREVYRKVLLEMQAIDVAIGNRINATPQEHTETVTVSEIRPSPFKCPKCGHDMSVRTRKNNDGFYIGCSAFPACTNAIWLPREIKNVTISDDSCRTCGSDFKKIKFEFINASYGCYTNPHVACLGGCDRNILNDFNIQIDRVKKINSATADSGIVSNGSRNFTSSQTSSRTTNINRPVNNFPNSNNTASVSWGRGDLNSTRSDGGFSSSMPDASFSSSMRMPRASTVDSNDMQVICGCSLPAVLLTVRRDGPNKGRKFYKCNRGKDNGGCDFFLWAPDSDEPGSQNNAPSSSFLPPPRPQHGNPGQANDRTNTTSVYCTCGEVAIKRTVQKDTPNKGRSFYACPKPQGSQCKFFKWADEVDGSSNGDDGDDWGGGGPRGDGPRPPSNGWNQNPGTSWGSGSGSFFNTEDNGNRGKWAGKKRKAPSTNNAGGKTKRKCGICGEEGHNKSKCPHKL